MKPIHVVKVIAAKTQSELDAILPELKALSEIAYAMCGPSRLNSPEVFGTHRKSAA